MSFHSDRTLEIEIIYFVSVFNMMKRIWPVEQHWCFQADSGDIKFNKKNTCVISSKNMISYHVSQSHKLKSH